MKIHKGFTTVKIIKFDEYIDVSLSIKATCMELNTTETEILELMREWIPKVFKKDVAAIIRESKSNLRNKAKCKRFT